MAFSSGDIINIRIFFLVIHYFRLFHHLYGNYKFLEQLQRKIIITPVADNFQAATYLKLQYQKAAGAFIQYQFYMCLAVFKILLLELFKERIINQILELVNP